LTLTPLAELVFFLSAYSPLFVIFGVFGAWGEVSVNRGSLAVGVLSPWLLALVLWVVRNHDKEGQALSFVKAAPRDGDAVVYVLTYIVPFIVLGSPQLELRIVLVLMLFLVAVLTLRGHAFYVNPCLAFVGYRTYDVETESGRTLVVLTRRRYLDSAISVKVVQLSDRVRIDARRLKRPSSTGTNNLLSEG
jgi:hypothetical protein